MSKQCERCTEPALPTRRFCKACQKIVLSEMKGTGYLAPATFGHKGDNRTTEHREVINDTKYGISR